MKIVPWAVSSTLDGVKGFALRKCDKKPRKGYRAQGALPANIKQCGRTHELQWLESRYLQCNPKKISKGSPPR